MSKTTYKIQRKHRKKKQIWPLIMLVAGAVVLVYVAVTALNRPSETRAAVEVKGSPSLKVDKEKVDLGEVKLGQTVEVKFQIMNVGDQTLRFTKAPYIEVVEGC